MSEVMEIEARLKNLVSGEMGKITRSIETNAVATKNLENKYGGLGVSAKKLIGILGGFTIMHKVNSFISTSIESAKKQVDAQQKLSAALGYTSVRLTDYASEMQRLTTYGDEEIMEAQSLIANFIKEEGSIEKVTKATLNLATAKKMDLRAAADLITKSIASTTNALTRYGIEVEQTNNKDKRMESLLKNIENAFGGMAEEMAKTDVGKIKQLNNLLDDQKEILGIELLPLTIEWYNLLMKITNIAIPTLSDTAKGWAWLLGGEKEHKRQIEQMNAVTKEVQNLLALRKEWEDVIAFKGSSADSIIQAKNNIETINESIKQLLGKGKAPNGTSGSIITNDMIKEIKKREKEIKDIIEQIDNDLLTSKSEYYDQLKEMSINYDTDRMDEEIAYQRMTLDALDQLDAARVNAIEDAYKQEIEALRLKHQQELVEYENNEEAKALIIQKHKIEDADLERKQITQKKKDDEDLIKSRVSNIEYGTDAAFQSIRNLQKASKAGSAAQKVLDIAQATANMAIGITKAVTGGPATWWQIPFVTATGMTQIALIQSQKYALGGIVPGVGNNDSVHAMLTPGEMVLNKREQSALFDVLSKPGTINNSTSNSSTAINLHINVGNNGNYNMDAARFTVDSLVPVIGDVLLRAHNERRLHAYENAR